MIPKMMINFGFVSSVLLVWNAKYPSKVVSFNAFSAKMSIILFAAK
jgi:hypothetical protein